MDSTETIRNMRENLAEIEKIIAWMEKSRDIHQIDIDVLLETTRCLYSQVIHLPPGRYEIQEKAEPSAIAAETIPQPAPAPAPMPEPVPLHVSEPVPEPEPEFTPIPQPSQPPPQSQQSRPSQPPQPSFQLFELAKDPVPVQTPTLFKRDGSLNEALGKQKPVHDIASSITDIPVDDIWSAITINERFLFIRELFGNDPEGFKNTVALLNSLGSWEAAKKFMNERFEWDKNNPVAMDFLNVVRRRFLK